MKYVQPALYGSFSKAVAAKKPLVALFTEDDLPHSEQLVHEIVETPALNSFAEGAVFVLPKGHYEDVNGNYAKLRKELNIERVPVLVMLEATKEYLKETGRIEGYYPTDQYLTKVGHRYLPTHCNAVGVGPACRAERQHAQLLAE